MDLDPLDPFFNADKGVDLFCKRVEKSRGKRSSMEILRVGFSWHGVVSDPI